MGYRISLKIFEHNLNMLSFLNLPANFCCSEPYFIISTLWFILESLSFAQNFIIFVRDWHLNDLTRLLTVFRALIHPLRISNESDGAATYQTDNYHL